jgi:hypothetical protein
MSNETATTQPTLADQLNAHLASGGSVQVCTYTQARMYGPRCVGMFMTDKAGCTYVKRGKRNWDCIDGNAIRLYRPA